MPARIRWRDETSLGGLLLLISCAVYANSLRNGFLWDDFGQILQNPFVHNFRHLPEVFTRPVWFFQGAQGASLSYYRPVMTVVNLLGWRLFGGLPFGYHVVNVGLNAMVVCLVFLVGKRLFQDGALAFFAAALFALHPIHTESVAWIAGATDLELAFFSLLTFWWFLALGEADSPAALGNRLCLAGSFALALLSKETAVTLPVLATIYEHGYRGDRARTSIGQKASRYGLLWILTGLYLLVRLEMLGGLVSSRRPGVSFYEMALTAFALAGRYATKLVWPVHLALFYSFHKSASLREPAVLLGIAVVALLVWIWFAAGRRRPAGFAVLWLALTLAPALDIRLLVANVFAERYLYLPSVGFCWLAAYGARRAWIWLRVGHRAAIWRSLAAGAALVVALLCAARVVTRNEAWRTPETFVVDAAGNSVNSESDFAPLYLGGVYWERGDVGAAERQWMAAYQTHPNDATLLEYLGLLRARQHRSDEAAGLFERAIALQPNTVSIREAYGKFSEEIGRRDVAEAQFRVAVGISPFGTDARNALGLLLLKEARFDEAEEQFSESLKVDPTPAAFRALGDIYLHDGNSEKAEWAFQHVADGDPFDGHAHFALGRLYEARGSSRDAVREYQAALQTDPNNHEAIAAVARLKQ